MALHVPKAPGFAQMLKDGAMVSFFLAKISHNDIVLKYKMLTLRSVESVFCFSTCPVWKKRCIVTSPLANSFPTPSRLRTVQTA